MSDQPPRQGDMARWEAEFNQLMTAQREDGEETLDYDEAMKEAWEKGLGNYGDSYRNDDDGRLRFDEDGAPILGNYVFGVSILVPPPGVVHIPNSFLRTNQQISCGSTTILSFSCQGTSIC